MKTLKYKYSIILFVSIFTFIISSCVTNNDTNSVIFNEPYGVLPVITKGNVVFDLLNPTTSSIDFIVEPSKTNGTVITSGEIFASYNGGSFKKVADMASFPYSYTTTLENVLTQLGGNTAGLLPTDDVTFKFYFLSDSGVNMTSSEVVKSSIVCPPLVGTYTIFMHDSYGDGWQGGGINVNIDGQTTFITMQSSYNGGPPCCGWNDTSATFVVPNGSLALTLEYVNDSYPSEVSFEIFDPNGVNIGSFGPTPPVGPLTITSTCP